ncbi:hypothetical protein RHGRI_012509 [Rhododendron griersonianum]|uniref:Uncharacterized protein n=1 Tax=Rhododendron griersonianum TaxID=479676 RepID=A0AAV6KRA2_9ERIC|nr:hypothetical protein RHGRI_012509 [Rhododendron griersonianum]
MARICTSKLGVDGYFDMYGLPSLVVEGSVKNTDISLIMHGEGTRSSRVTRIADGLIGLRNNLKDNSKSHGTIPWKLSSSSIFRNAGDAFVGSGLTLFEAICCYLCV